MAKFTHLSKQAILERPEFRATLPPTHLCTDSLIGRIYRNDGSACVVHIVLNLGTLGRVHVIQCKVKTTWNNLGQVSRNFVQCCCSENNLNLVLSVPIQIKPGAYLQQMFGAAWNNRDLFHVFQYKLPCNLGWISLRIHIRFSNSFQLHILSTFPGVELNSSFLNVTDGTCFMNYSYNKQVEPCRKNTRYWLIHFITVVYEKKNLVVIWTRNSDELQIS